MRSSSPRQPVRRLELDWIIVSVERLRRWGLWVLLVILTGAAAFTAYSYLHEPPRKRAERMLRQASAAEEQLSRAGVSDSLQGEFDQASLLLAQAREDCGRQEWSACEARAGDSLRRFQLLSGLVNGEFVGSGQIIAAQGKVEVQRANQSQWERATEKMPLYNGDFVKTGSEASAEILFSDGTIFRVGADSLLEMHRNARTAQAGTSGEVRVRVGQVNVYTALQPSTVITDAARAEVDRESRVGVEVDDAAATRVAAYAGGARVTSTSGESLDLSSRQAVTAKPAGALGPRVSIPDAPILDAPPANYLVNLDEVKSVLLRWRSVGGITDYQLQVSRSRTFAGASELLKTEPRKSTSARLKVLRPGTYFWRVAAVSPTGVTSEWSPSRSFRAFASPRLEELSDTTPPRLEVQRVSQMGTYLLLQGITEPGAVVTVDGEPVEVGSDGVFKKTVALAREGENVLVITATDPAGNVTEHRESVFLEGD